MHCTDLPVGYSFTPKVNGLAADAYHRARPSKPRNVMLKKKKRIVEHLLELV